MDSTVRVWNPNKGTAMGDGMKGHRNCITSIAFEPMHLNKNCNRFVTTSKDCTTRIWDAKTRKCEIVLSQHTMPVTCAKWGGDGLIYTGSRDKTIKVWDSKTGTLVRNLLGHAHWVNHLCLSTDFITRTGPFDHTDLKFSSQDEMHARALERYNEFVQKNGKERMASGSDDFTMFLWEQGEKKPIGRMTGHHQPVTHLSFSPDGTVLASACFDKSVKLWDGKSAK
jgi:ribosome assembly protein 4